MPRTIALLIVGAFVALFPVAAYAQPCEIPVRPIGVVGSVMPPHFVAGREYALLPGYGPGDYQHLDFSRMNPPTPSFCANGPCAGLTSAGGNGSRILIVPLVAFVPPQCTGNNCWARMEGYATYFLKRRYDPGQRAFYGEFLNYLACGSGLLSVTDETGAARPGDCGLGITLGGAARQDPAPR